MHRICFWPESSRQNVLWVGSLPLSHQTRKGHAIPSSLKAPTVHDLWMSSKLWVSLPIHFQVQRRDRVTLHMFSKCLTWFIIRLANCPRPPCLLRGLGQERGSWGGNGQACRDSSSAPEVGSQFQPHDPGATEVVVGQVCDCFRKTGPQEVKT